MEVIRYAFCIFNFLFLIAGSVLLGIGVWLLVDNRIVGTFIPNLQDQTLKFSPYLSIGEGGLPSGDDHGSTSIFPEDSLPKTMIYPLGWFSIIFGTFVFFLSFLGYCGALRDSVCLLGGYSILLGIVFILEVIAVILFFAYKPTVEKNAKEQLLLLVNQRYSEIAVRAAEAKSRGRILSYNPNKGHYTNTNKEKYYGEENYHTTPHPGIYSNGDADDDDGDNNNNNGRMDTIQVKPEEERDMTKNSFKEVVIFTKLFDSTMKSFNCCGVNNYLDFRLEQLKPNHKLPEACCKYGMSGSGSESSLLLNECVDEPNELNSFYMTGCFSRVIDSVTEYGIVGAIIIGLLQIVGIVFSACGARMIYQHSR